MPAAQSPGRNAGCGLKPDHRDGAGNRLQFCKAEIPSNRGLDATGSIGRTQADPKIVAAIFSVVESCRRLAVPIRNYLADTLPGLASRPTKTLAEFTPTTYVANRTK